mmetsp:Transcript_130599/g.260583  ORF Transcript_130599/g.260583 Transcript_130599/m.260583 type:complete len:310 (-) Transcript_130599:236-1165(-)
MGNQANTALNNACGCLCLEERHEGNIMEYPPHHVASIGTYRTSSRDQSPTRKRSPRCATDVYWQKRRLSAQCALRSASAGENLEEIMDAIARAKAVGVIQPELDDAQAAATRIQSRRKASEALAKALQLRDEGSLRQAVTLADTACMHNEQLEKATALLEEIENQAAEQVQECEIADPDSARNRKRTLRLLEDAMRTRGQRELMEAIAEAEAAGLACKRERVLLAQARVMLNIVNARKEVAARRRAREAGMEDEYVCSIERGQTWACNEREMSTASIDSPISVDNQKLQSPKMRLECEQLIHGEPPRGG